MEMLSFPFRQYGSAGSEIEQPSIPYMGFGTGRRLSFYLTVRPFSF
jgi:hypothetical protein